MDRKMFADPVDVSGHFQQHDLVAFVVDVQGAMGGRYPMSDVNRNPLGVDVLNAVENVVVAFPSIP